MQWYIVHRIGGVLMCTLLFQALGCVLYLLCFNEHPYEDSAKLRIINANYTIPESDTECTVFHDLIRKSSCSAHS